MSWRTVVISSQAKLDYRMGYLVVRGRETKKILLDEIAVLLLENPAVSLTGCLLARLTEKKVKVIFCDDKRNPTAELIPHHGCHDSSAKIRAQAAWPDDVKGLVWQEIVAEKIRKQADFLQDLGKRAESALLRGYIGEIAFADQTNREGHAAKVYFNALFGMDFSRGADSPVNAALDYGYSMILSAFNREIAADGYLTQLGIFHNNRFNPFNLGSDFMEPFRILTDRYVYRIAPKKFEKEEKHAMWNLLEGKVMIDGLRRSVSEAIRCYTRSVLEAVNSADVSKITAYQLDAAEEMFRAERGRQ